MIRRTARILARVTVLAVVAVAVAALAFVWRLSQGPIALDPLAPYVERALSDAEGGVTVSIDSLELRWTNETETGSHVLDLRAQHVRAAGPTGTTIAAVPELGIGFSLRELLFGRLEPTRLDLIRPQLTVVRHEDGRYGFDIREGDAAPAAEAGTPVAGDVFDTLRRPPNRERTFGLLRQLTVVSADLRVENRQLGVSWRASRTHIALHRGDDGIDGRARLALDLGGETATVEAAGTYSAADGGTTAALRVDGLELARLAQVAPALEPLAVAAVPVGGAVTAVLGPDFLPAQLRFDLTVGAGGVRLPARAAPYEVRSGRLRGSIDVPQRRLSLDDLALDAAGLRLGLAGTLMDEPDGPIGDVRLTLAAGERVGTLHAVATPGRGGPRVAATLKDVEPALLAGLAPELAPLAAAALPISGTVEADLDGRFLPRSGRADLTAGPGRIDTMGLLEGPVEVAALTLRAGHEAGSDGLALEALTIDLGGPTVRVAGQAGVEAERLTAAVEAVVHGLPIDELHRYWPPAVSPNARHWVVSNLSRGIATEARLTLRGEAPRERPEAFEPTHVDAVIEGEGFDVNYFAPLPPVTGVGQVRATSDGRTFAIQTKGGRIEDVAVGDADILIHDLGGKERIEIDVPVRGPVRTILSVLDSPPLEYPKRLDLDPKRTAGTADARLKLRFPLLVDLSVDQIDVGVNAKLTGVAVEKVAAGLDATDGALDLALDIKGMTVKGNAKLDGVPAHIDWRESFVSDGKGPRTRVAVKTTPDAADFTRFIPDPAGYAAGPVGTDIVFTIDQRKRMGLTGTLDLAKTALTVPELGWSKPPGTPATGRFALEFQKDKVAKVTGIAVEGGGLKAAGTIELTPATSALSRIRVAELAVGKTSVRAEVAARGGGYVAEVTGDSLDLAAFLKKQSADTAPAARRPPLQVAARLGRVVFGDERQLTHVIADLRNNGESWTRLDIKGRAGDAGSLSVDYGPQGPRHQLSVVAEDAGTVLRMLDLNDRVQGGTLRINGTTQGPQAEAPLEGDIEMRDYTIVKAPTLARILNAVSPSGLAELMGGKGISFGRLTGTFRKEGRLLNLKDMRTSGGALGLTLEGQVDITTEVANLRGTIVPLYGINRIIGQIPLLGDALSGGAGQGIFSATWHVQGPLSDPEVTVNPLAVLAPGFLRNLFFLGDGVRTGQEGTQPAPDAGQHGN